VTLDPARDEPARLKDYVESFGPDFVGLTGPETHVANLAARYHVRYAKAPGVGPDYAIDHSAEIYILGQEGSVLERTPSDRSVAKPADALRAALAGD
jgi:protein SCO1/2